MKVYKNNYKYSQKSNKVCNNEILLIDSDKFSIKSSNDKGWRI